MKFVVSRLKGKRGLTYYVLLLMCFEDYFKSAGYGSGGANGFALSTPVAFYCLDNGDDIPS